MRAVFSAGAHRDVKDILEYYSKEAGPEIAADFHSELNVAVRRIKRMPKSFPLIHGELRRAIMERFPYQVVFKIQSADLIRILVVRHHKRHQDFGLGR